MKDWQFYMLMGAIFLVLGNTDDTSFGKLLAYLTAAAYWILGAIEAKKEEK